MRRRRTGAQDHRKPWSIKPRTDTARRSSSLRPEKFAAWLGLAGVVVGAIMAGLIGLLTNRETISAQSKQATSEFIRDQRLEAYTAFADHEQEL